MKKILLFTGCIFLASALLAQDSTMSPVPVKKEAINLANRSNDHFLLQLGYTGWNGIPDTINTKGLSKSVNVYFMFDFPFKTNPKMSIAFGAGVSTDQILFSKTYVGIKDLKPQIYFTNQADTNHFKKTKLATAYLEAPIELRYSANPYSGKGLKVALGVKVGTLLNAHTRNSKYQNPAGTSLNDYVMKEASKKFFNKNRLSAMLRVGSGHFSIYGTYQFTTLFKDGSGPVVRPYSIGITLSGL